MTLRAQPLFERSLGELQCVLLARRAAMSNDSMKLAWIDFDIMDYLQVKGDCTPSELCTIFHISRSSMSKHLKRLKNYELIYYSPNDRDGRSYYVSIAAPGRELMDGVYEGQRRLAANAEAALTDEEKQQFIVLARKIYTSLDDPSLHVI